MFFGDEFAEHHLHRRRDEQRQADRHRPDDPGAESQCFERSTEERRD